MSLHHLLTIVDLVTYLPRKTTLILLISRMSYLLLEHIQLLPPPIGISMHTFVILSLRPTPIVDRAANGGLAGADMKIIEKTGFKVDKTGIVSHEITGLDVVTCLTPLKVESLVSSMNMHI